MTTDSWQENSLARCPRSLRLGSSLTSTKTGRARTHRDNAAECSPSCERELKYFSASGSSISPLLSLFFLFLYFSACFILPALSHQSCPVCLACLTLPAWLSMPASLAILPCVPACLSPLPVCLSFPCLPAYLPLSTCLSVFPCLSACPSLPAAYLPVCLT